MNALASPSWCWLWPVHKQNAARESRLTRLPNESWQSALFCFALQVMHPIVDTVRPPTQSHPITFDLQHSSATGQSVLCQFFKVNKYDSSVAPQSFASHCRQLSTLSLKKIKHSIQNMRSNFVQQQWQQRLQQQQQCCINTSFGLDSSWGRDLAMISIPQYSVADKHSEISIPSSPVQSNPIQSNQLIGLRTWGDQKTFVNFWQFWHLLPFWNLFEACAGVWGGMDRHRSRQRPSVGHEGFENTVQKKTYDKKEIVGTFHAGKAGRRGRFLW